jgi:alcohol dehydrogenase class IV
MSPFTFAAPTTVAFGPGRIKEIAGDADRLAGKAARVLVISDPGVVNAGLAARAVEALEAGGHTVTLFADVRSDPLSAQIDAAAGAARDCGARLVVGIGGGSSLDVAKLAATIAPSGRPGEDFALGRNALPKDGLPRICVPTTAGTGSEVTRTSVFTTAAHRKVWAWGERNRAHLALLDPELTLALPAKLTAATGIDAMVHAIEGATVNRANACADAPCLHAIRLLSSGALERAVKTPDDVEARGAVLMAATLAGIGFDATGTGIAHAMGHAIGAIAGVHHGRAVGLCLNAALAWNAEAAPARHAAIARALGAAVDGMDEARAAALAAPAFERLIRAVGLEVSLAGDGLTAKDAGRIAKLTLAEENKPMCQANARRVTPEAARILAERLLAAA